MKKNSEFRYDPLYRVIDESDELRIIEGSFHSLFDRLKRINNLGIIPEVFEMAKYPKYEHGLGTIHQINSLLDVSDEDQIPDKYKAPLKVASIFLHLGHLPYTYSTERAFLIASNLGDRSQDNPVRKYINKKIETVLSETDFEKSEKQNIKDDLFSLREYKELYKCFSAYYLVQNWNQLIKKIEDLKEDNLQIVIRNLIDKDSPGYDYLNLADKADYVQRDALYFGTTKIDVPPKHLYSQLALSEKDISVSEKALIEYNRKYLSEKYYTNYEVLWFSRLYEKILASLIVSKNFKFAWLDESGDEELKRLVCDNFDLKNNRTKLPRSWVRRGKALFSGKTVFNKVLEVKGIHSQNEHDAIDFEYELIGKEPSIRGLLTYPFDRGTLLSIEYYDQDRIYHLPDQDLFTVILFQDESQKSLYEILRIIQNMSNYISVLDHSERIRNGLGCELSWTRKVRFDNDSVIREISNAILSVEENTRYEKGGFIRRYLTSLSTITTHNQLWNNFENRYIWKSRILDILSETAIDDEIYDSIRGFFVYGLLGLPVRLLQYETTKKYLDMVIAELNNSLSSDLSNSRKGDIFEALCLLENIHKQRGVFQYVLNGLIVTDPDKPKGKRDDNEFDVIKLSIDGDGTATIHISACSISDDYESKNREQITSLADHLHDVFPDLRINTFYVIPENKSENRWSPIYVDTGRNYNLSVD